MGAMTGKVALIMGASRGIGAATARRFAREGAKVGLAARDRDALERVAADIADDGGEAVPIRTDVTDPEQVEQAVATVLDRFGRLDAAFNNATAGYPPKPIPDTESEEFARAIAANVHGTFLGMKFQIPAMRETGGGAIVNMASEAGLRGVSYLAGYTSGKAGIIALTKVAALENADLGVRVNVLAPGPILTHHLERAGAEAQRQAAASVPMGRTGTADEVAAAVLWLSGSESSFITGITVPIDGGQSAGVKPPQMYESGKPMAPKP